MNKFILGLLFCSFFITSCEKKETPITLPVKGDGKLMQVDMGETYELQYFINLREQKIVHISKIDNWDLAFQSGDNQHSIFLNGGKGMAAYNTNKTKFEDVNYNDTLQAKTQWDYDSPKGLIDSSAIGDWKKNNTIYLVKLNESGSKVRKLQITYEDAFQYIISVGDIASTIPYSVTIIKNKDCNYTYFSFDLLTTVSQVEPNKNSWDLQITRFNYTFYDQNPALRYIVNGVLINPSNTFAYKDSLTNYNDINTDFATTVPLSNERDIIGFDWKTYDIDKGVYTVVKKYNFIIKTQNDNYFKLHFLDFYSANGVKGSPKFEFNQLK